MLNECKKGKAKWINLVLFFLWLSPLLAQQQDKSVDTLKSQKGWFSLGMRSTVSAFSHDGAGLGTGGQFRIQLNNKVNTDWFADYITIGANNIHSEYYHIGWSVLFYPFSSLRYPSSKWQPFVLAGHCFDFNRKTVISMPEITKSRWGSAVQSGIGVHYHLTKRLDFTLMSQYMIHLTKELHVHMHDGVYEIGLQDPGLEGHLLTTLSVNYRIAQLWDR